MKYQPLLLVTAGFNGCNHHFLATKTGGENKKKNTQLHYEWWRTARVKAELFVIESYYRKVQGKIKSAQPLFSCKEMPSVAVGYKPTGVLSQSKAQLDGKALHLF